MAKLFTHHDPFHVHKILGLLILVNFAYRFSLLVWRGYAFCHRGSSDSNGTCSSDNEMYWDLASVLLHGALSWSSLLLPLPLKRNFKSPMIWREFRWHSIIFATRSVVGTIFSILSLWPQQNLILNFASKLALTLGTCYAADYATKKHGCRTNRTTNAMAYPEYVTAAMQQKIKLNYSMAQMTATISCVTEDPTYSFLPLYAIQGAAFLMTLRRKNLISTRNVHFIYQLQLCTAYLPTLLGVFRLETDPSYWAPIFLLGGLQLVAGYLRIDCRYSKEATWSTILFILTAFMHTSILQEVLVWFHTHPAGIAYVINGHVNEYQRAFRHYLPVFLGRAISSSKKSDTTKPPPQGTRQSLSQDLLENDLLEYPNRRQRFIFVILALLGTHDFQVPEVARNVLRSLSGQSSTI